MTSSRILTTATHACTSAAAEPTVRLPRESFTSDRINYDFARQLTRIRPLLKLKNVNSTVVDKKLGSIKNDERRVLK